MEQSRLVSEPESDDRQQIGRRDGDDTLNVSRLRELIPASGFREYWYPALMATRVPSRRPVFLKIADVAMVLFRDTSGEVVALDNTCVHRGGFLSHGRCDFAGTVSCPYHGWVYDGSGQCVAVLGEGPESRIPGMPRARVRKFPTRTLKGLVFVWTGETEPAPIEEDVPEQFFDDDACVQISISEWPCNWRPAMENMLDAHVYYVHRNSVFMLLQPTNVLMNMAHMGPRRPKPEVFGGRGVAYTPDTQPGLAPAGDRPNSLQVRFAGLDGQPWPRTNARAALAKAVAFARRALPSPGPPMVRNLEWNAAHLPGTFQQDFRKFLYTRMTVPIDEHRCRMVYAHTTRPDSARRAFLGRVYFKGFHNWLVNYNFSRQDMDVVVNQNYGRPEMLSSSDVFPLAVRRLMAENNRDRLRGVGRWREDAS
jgi:phenylpropionate dioxygenase-like ring-hydroxylating dioxygenase large terminal subunit